MMKKYFIFSENRRLRSDLAEMLEGYIGGGIADADYVLIDLTAQRGYTHKLLDILKSLCKRYDDFPWRSAVILLPDTMQPEGRTEEYLAQGMCKSFACEAAEHNFIVNIILCGGYDRRLAELCAFFSSERAYMTAQVIKPDLSAAAAAMPDSPVALVTGSGQGIGLAALKELKRLGFRVCLNDIRSSARISESIRSIGALNAVGDISDPAGIDDIINSVMREYGRLDVFVANAAYMHMESVSNLTESDFDKHIAVNVNGHMNLLERIIPVMKNQGGGRIILMSSMFGTAGWRNAAAYAGTKAAMIGLGQALSASLMQYGIRVGIVAPCIIDTPQLAADAQSMGVTINEMKKIYARDIPLGRLGTAEDAAYLIGYLANGGADILSARIMQTGGGEVRTTAEYF